MPSFASEEDRRIMAAIDAWRILIPEMVDAICGWRHDPTWRDTTHDPRLRDNLYCIYHEILPYVQQHYAAMDTGSLRELYAICKGWTDGAGSDALPPQRDIEMKLEMSLFSLAAIERAVVGRTVADAAGESTPAATEPTEADDGGKEAKALMMLLKNPTWSDKRIAAAAGCHAKSLPRMLRYQAARAAERAARDELPRGSKTGGNDHGNAGRIEASDDDF